MLIFSLFKVELVGLGTYFGNESMVDIEIQLSSDVLHGFVLFSEFVVVFVSPFL